jgi:hypothetical protein
LEGGNGGGWVGIDVCGIGLISVFFGCGLTVFLVGFDFGGSP